MQNHYIGENCLKRGAWTVCRFKVLGKGEGDGIFEEGVDTQMHTMARRKDRQILLYRTLQALQKP